MRVMQRIQLARSSEDWPSGARRGAALVPTLVVVATLVVFSLALMTVGMTGARTVNHHEDDYRLSSAVESIGVMSVEKIWTAYLGQEGGAAGDMGSFRQYLTDQGIVPEYNYLTDEGQPQPPTVDDGTDITEFAEIPAANGNPEFNGVNIDTVRIVRYDVDVNSTQLYLTISASTKKGEGLVNPVLNRALQQVYTIEPSDFAGFDYGILANNVNCIFCHTSVDRVERYYDIDFDGEAPGEAFERIKVGTLESLMVRHNMIDGNDSNINDFDADSFVAGSVYVRGTVTDHDGAEISDWADLTFKGYEFEYDTATGAGLLVEDFMGDLTPVQFQPATGVPPPPGENLYLDYPEEYAEMPDGDLPTSFPSPFPDTGGVDPATGLPTSAGANNRVVDDEEFYLASLYAEGSITAGVATVHTGTAGAIDTSSEYAQALYGGTVDFESGETIQQKVDGNVVLTGTEEVPIKIEGTVAIDGDLIINGYIEGSGSLLVRGNVYIPTNLQYNDDYITVDGVDGEVRLFGSAGGKENAFGLAAGGNIMIGDFLRSATLQADWTGDAPAWNEIVSGSPDPEGDKVDEWSFVLAELSLFNRGEWAKTQPVLPGPGEADLDPSMWTAANPGYQGADYLPRYYAFGPDDEIPIYNKGAAYWDPDAGSWITSAYLEVPLDWDPSLLTIANPTDPSDPTLYDQVTGEAKAVISQITPTDGWISDQMYKLGVEYFEGQHETGEPMKIDGLLYTNNAIFGLVNRDTPMQGQMLVNGALVAADLGLLVPGKKNNAGIGTDENLPGSSYKPGLQLNYDERLRDQLTVVNPNQVQIKRTLWNPTANLL